METDVTKDQIIAAMLTAFKEVQTVLEGEEEVTADSLPGEDFVYIDSEILLQLTGTLSDELGIEIPAKCQIFLGDQGEQLTVEQAAQKVLNLTSKDGPR